MAEWRAVSFRELGQLFDGPHATPSRVAEGPYFMNIASLKNGRLDLSKSDHVSEEDFARWTRRVTPAEGDLLFSYETRLGDAALMPPGVRACLGRRMALLRPNRERFDPRFLLYYWLSPDFQAVIERNTIHGATVNRIPLSAMDDWIVTLPPLEEQREIGDVLGALDDKIAANALLLTLADHLVRAEWDSAVFESADTVPLALLASAVRDLEDPSRASTGSVYVGLEHVPRRHMWLDSWGEAQVVTSAKTRFAKGDVLFGKLRPYFHKVVSAPSVGICSTDIIVMRAHENALAGFVLAAASSDAVVQWASASSAGTRMPRTSWLDMAPVEIPWPGASAAREFSTRVVAIRDAVEARIRESQSLAVTRDALLPALMSGRLRVRDAQRDTAGRSQVG